MFNKKKIKIVVVFVPSPAPHAEIVFHKLSIRRCAQIQPPDAANKMDLE